ncbi:MAG: DUF1571 domain-containing protein, partial [Phycisphaerae bacterium]|nr:DUF1571 domain-containing protein [Phycisphaerae bacterium]
MLICSRCRPGDNLTTRRTALAGLILAAGLLAGCAAKPDITPRPGPLEGAPSPELDQQTTLVSSDPVAYLHKVADNCSHLEQYTLKFTRYERRGLFRVLYGPEHIDAWFRQTPFSIRLKWTDEDIKHGESVYVEGQYKDKVRFVTRWWVPPLLPPPGINTVDLQTPVFWGETKRPLTDFGLRRLMERTIISMDEAGDQVRVEYLGLGMMPGSNHYVHHLRLTYPEKMRPVPLQELYVDTESDLPVG